MVTNIISKHKSVNSYRRYIYIYIMKEKFGVSIKSTNGNERHTFDNEYDAVKFAYENHNNFEYMTLNGDFLYTNIDVKGGKVYLSKVDIWNENMFKE